MLNWVIGTTIEDIVSFSCIENGTILLYSAYTELLDAIIMH